MWSVKRLTLDLGNITSNTMAKRKGTEGQAKQWPKEKDRRTSNTMAKRKGTKGQTTQWPKEKGQKDKQRSTN
jgi:uncharacterized protein YdaU (DUF1376 family)